MTPAAALSHLVKDAVTPAKARRYLTLLTSQKGQIKFLSVLPHEFEQFVRPKRGSKSKKYDQLWSVPCFVFSLPKNFGIEHPTLRDAYDSLATTDSWLIVAGDGTFGIHRPEDRWDDEVLIVGTP